MRTLLFTVLGAIALAQSPHAATLTWSAGGGGTPVTYIVLRSTASGGPYSTQVASVPATSTTYVDTSAAGNVLAEGQTYCYVIVAVNAAGTSPNSKEACWTVPLTAPAAPTGLTVSGK